MLKKSKTMMILGIIFSLLLIFVGIIIFLLVKDDYRPMNYEDFVDFNTEEILKNNKNYLIISGQYYGSSLKIKKVEEEFKNGDIVIKVYTTLFSKNDSSFLHSVELNDSVNRILFGMERRVIWKKNN